VAPASSAEIATLARILTQEQRIYQQLLEIAGEERSAIVEAKLPDLKEVLQRKQLALARLATLEERRLKWLGRYARQHELDMQAVTLTSIIDGCPAGDRQLLGRLHRGLRARIDKVVELNQATSRLLEGVLKSIDTSLRYLLLDDGSTKTYVAQGRLQGAAVPSRQLLDCRV